MKKLFLCIAFILAGCTTTNTTIVSTNNLIQTDYEYNCLDENRTFSEIIICYKAQDNAEKAQNAVTNKYLEAK